MRKNREVESLRGLTDGPGKLTRALAITEELNGVDATDRRSVLTVIEGEEREFEIASSHRVGVRTDLPQELRYFIRRNRFVSKSV